MHRETIIHSEVIIAQILSKPQFEKLMIAIKATLHNQLITINEFTRSCFLEMYAHMSLVQASHVLYTGQN